MPMLRFSNGTYEICYNVVTLHFGYVAFSTKNAILVFVFFKTVWSCNLFYLFLKENKIRKKTLNVTHNMK